MVIFVGTHKFEAIKIGEQRLTYTLDGYQHQITTIQNALDGYVTTASASTLGHFTVRINSSTGTDVFAHVITTQALADTHGPFATLEGVFYALPNNISHMVVFSFDDGAHSLTNVNFAENLGRFTFSPLPDGYFFEFSSTETLLFTGCFIFQSTNGMRRVSGTSVMTVATLASSNRDFTVSVDPGFTADAYAGYFLRTIDSPADNSWLRAISTHNGVNFTIAGHFHSGGGLVGKKIEIVKAQASIDLDAAGSYAEFVLNVQGNSGAFATNLVLNGIDLTSTAGSTLYLICNSGMTGGARVIGASLIISNGHLYIDQGVVDCNNLGFGIYMLNGKFRSASSESSSLVRRSTGSGLTFDTRPDIDLFTSTGYVFKFSIDSCVDGMTLMGPNTVVTTHSNWTGINNTGYGVVIKQGAILYREQVSQLAADRLTGALGDFRIDNTTVSYAELESDGAIEGNRRSLLINESSY